MQKQIEKIEKKLEKIENGEMRVLEGEFPNSWEFILKILNKRRDILEKTKRKLIKLNQNNFVNFTL